MRRKKKRKKRRKKRKKRRRKRRRKKKKRRNKLYIFSAKLFASNTCQCLRQILNLFRIIH